MGPLAASPDLLRDPASALPGQPKNLEGQNLQAMRRTAEAFEASFLSQMMKPMFEGLSTEAPFGGGAGEAAWRGFLVDAMAQQTVKSGGVGLADSVLAQMIKMQEQGA
ncbi:rod-binding protein [Brevundimonas naejangsanensis]|uniref:Rod-binding protein n=1 Tax=Brevundimonas naejangsanensis TaxID=588932 RepID=A0A172Y4R4_9CAUL|nr:rod-binding protein [Brevundimonas naejangsanensis]ANF54214.1 rod-binding protein [Brevundimonas naejangsanensis]